MSGQHEIEELGAVIKATAKVFPIINASLDELRQTLKLNAANGSLNIEWFEIIAEVGIDVFVVVALGEFAELPVESFAAGIVFAAGAPAIAAPIAEAFDDGFELDAADYVDCPAFAEREVMRGIKGLRGKIAECAGEFVVVTAAEGVAIVFDEEKVVLFTELGHCGEVEGITECVRHEDSFGFAGLVGFFELLDAGVEGDRVVVDEDRDETVLKNGRDGGWKSGGDGDDFITGHDAVFFQARAGKGGGGEQVGGGARIAKDAGFCTEEFGEAFLEFFAFFTESKPEIEGGGNGGGDFLFGEDAAGVRDDGRAGNERIGAILFVTGAIGAVGEAGKFRCQTQNLCF